MNFILDTDSYKLSHFLGYPAQATHIYSYAESRGGRYPETVFFGIQKFVKELAKVRLTLDDVIEAQEFAQAHGEPFNDQWFDLIGKPIPVIIKAVPEGSVVGIRNVLVTVENTDPTMPWLTSFIETALLRAVWYPVTVATRIHNMKKKIKPYFEETSDVGDMSFALLDFSARGCSSLETARIGGLAHLVSFMGSDNIPAVLAAKKFYDEPMAAFSVPATEHSIMTGFGQDGEWDSFQYLIENMMQENGILSVVSDTWDVYNACKMWGGFAGMIRAKNGTLVVRPDSGEMTEVMGKIIPILLEGFGYDVNQKGYKVLRNCKILWGDGINEDTVTDPFEVAKQLGVSSDSIMTGSGGGLMQANIDRDTCKFAFKASNITFQDGTSEGIAKDPITDPGKKSKMGKLKLIDDVGNFITVTDEDKMFAILHDELRVVYENGELKNVEDFATIRARLAATLR